MSEPDGLDELEAGRAAPHECRPDAVAGEVVEVAHGEPEGIPVQGQAGLEVGDHDRDVVDRPEPGGRAESRGASRERRPSDGQELAMLAPGGSEAVADLAQRRVGLHGLDHRRQDVLAAAGGRLEPGQRSVPGHGIAVGADPAQALDLAPLAVRVDVLGRRRFGRRVVDEPVEPDHDLLAGLDRPLDDVGRLLDLALLEAGLDRLERSAQGVDLGQELPGRRLDLVGQGFDVPGARPAGRAFP